MDRPVLRWMKIYGFWPTWAAVSLAITFFSELVSVALMILLLGYVSRRGLIIGFIVPVILCLTVQRAYMRMLHDLDAARARMETLARTDELTGVANRRSILSLVEKEFARSQRSCQPFLLMIFDLNDFKQVNDRYGHPAGDRVLQAVAKVVQANVREIDTLARIGGDEFVLLAPGAEVSEGPDLSTRIRELIVGLRVEVGGGEAYTPEACIGWTAWNCDMVEVEELLKAADRALYAQKALKESCRPPLAPAGEGGSPQDSSQDNPQKGRQSLSAKT